MFYKRKKPFIHVFISFILYSFLTVFILVGLFHLLNSTYEDINKTKQEESNEKLLIDLKPFPIEDIVSNNMIETEKEKEIEIPLPKDPNIINAMKVIENYYISNINKNIKKHFSANDKNMCKMLFNVSTSELKIVSCDDFTFQRQIELSLVNVKPYKNKIINSVDLSKEIVYFDYLIDYIK